MKNVIILSTILIFSISFISCEKESQSEAKIDLTGVWLGAGYQCPIGVSHEERIEITHSLSTGDIVATKVTGDNCVTAGNITFTGVFDGVFNSSASDNFFEVTFVTGSISSPNSSTSESTLEIVNSNLFRDVALEGIVFTRQ